MKLFLCLITAACLFSCNPGEKPANEVVIDTPVSETAPADTLKRKKVELPPADTLVDPPVLTVYSNETFKNVSVKATGEGQFHVTGKARVFEAVFGWAVEDGHEELVSGHSMTNAGPPEFGDFSFDIRVKKKRANSTLHLLIFENSANDGSRIHQLKIKLY